MTALARLIMRLIFGREANPPTCPPHQYRIVAEGLAGWSVWECTTCHRRDIT